MGPAWLRIRVELVGGRTEPALWPRPARVLAADPRMTFRDLAQGIDLAFARWDRAHLHQFVLADGTTLMPRDPWHDEDPAADAVTASDPGSGAARELDDATTLLSRLEVDEQFLYEFDLDAGWKHLCTVEPEAVDPDVELGGRPSHPVSVPVSVAGWGTIPDQHGDVWFDDAERRERFHADEENAGREPVVGPLPSAPDPPFSDLPPLAPGWGPVRIPGRVVDWSGASVGRLDSALTAEDDDAIIELLTEHDSILVAQRCASALIRLADRSDPAAGRIVRDVIARLGVRDWPGDEELADLLAERHAGLESGPPAGSDPAVTDAAAQAARRDRLAVLRPTPVDLETLSAILTGSLDPNLRWVLEVSTGRLLAPSTDPTPGPDDPVVLGLGPHPLLEDLRAIGEALGMPIDQDTTWTGRVLLDERRLGRARGWLTGVGLRSLS